MEAKMAGSSEAAVSEQEMVTKGQVLSKGMEWAVVGWAAVGRAWAGLMAAETAAMAQVQVAGLASPPRWEPARDEKFDSGAAVAAEG